ncbi:hypothetical protein TNCV_1674941 [Trichonephila clavipes]|nr:hypothetical protein TNCV_1674941 [Trichonephila clavipes]
MVSDVVWQWRCDRYCVEQGWADFSRVRTTAEFFKVLRSKVLRSTQCQWRTRHRLDDVTRWWIVGRREAGQSQATCCRDLKVSRSVVSILWKTVPGDGNSGPPT